MKKLSLVLLFFACFLVTGCGNNSESDVLGDLDKKINNSKGYVMTGSLEVLNNDDIYNYEVETAYKKDDYYKITLTNTSNNHEQIILKNDDGVYVQTHESTQQKKLNSLRLYPLKV